MRIGDVQASEDNLFDPEDPFTRALMDYEGSDGFSPVEVDITMLQAMRKGEVYIQKWPSPDVSWTFYRSMIPDIAIVQCEACNHFFHEEEWEFLMLTKKACPFCRIDET